jgi:hypothetical protein
MRPMLEFLFQGWVAEGVPKECVYRLTEFASLRGEPVGSKGAVGEHTAIGIYDEGPELLRNTF